MRGASPSSCSSRVSPHRPPPPPALRDSLVTRRRPGGPITTSRWTWPWRWWARGRRRGVRPHRPGHRPHADSWQPTCCGRWSSPPPSRHLRVLVALSHLAVTGALSSWARSPGRLGTCSPGLLLARWSAGPGVAAARGARALDVTSWCSWAGALVAALLGHGRSPGLRPELAGLALVQPLGAALAVRGRPWSGEEVAGASRLPPPNELATALRHLSGPPPRDRGLAGPLPS